MIESTDSALFDPDQWCMHSLAQHREILAAALLHALGGGPGVTGAFVEVGPRDRPYDLTAAINTDVGVLRTALWSQARAEVFCDVSIHPENRRQFAPGHGVRIAVGRLRPRLSVPVVLEARGLTLTLQLEGGVERTWSAERSLFRGRAAVAREDRLGHAGEEDLQALLVRFYTGPALRLVGPDGAAFLLPAAHDDLDAEWVSLCHRCHHWVGGAATQCGACGAPVDVMSVTRPPRR